MLIHKFELHIINSLDEFELHKMTTRCHLLDCQTRLYILQPNNFAMNSHDSFIYNFLSALRQKVGIYNIKQVNVYESKSVIEQYRSKRTAFRDNGISCEEVWVFHGTPLDEVQTKIMCEGFKVGR